jgi:hypothetical protein
LAEFRHDLQRQAQDSVARRAPGVIVMRRVVLTLALLSLAFAPAPFPKPERRPRESEETRLVREYDARLRGLGVRWELRAGEGPPYVSFEVRSSGRAPGYGDRCAVHEGGLPAALRTVLRYVQRVEASRRR